jgi:hypothetical protein
MKINQEKNMYFMIFVLLGAFVVMFSFLNITSTNLIGSAITTVQSCTDTQNGFNKNVKGTIFGQYNNGDNFNFDDYCENSLSVWEYYCVDENSFSKILAKCDEDEKCEDGKCVPYTSTSETCEMIEGGVLYTNKLGEENLLFNDCYGDFGRRIEYSCSENKVIEEIFDCQKGCISGVCKTDNQDITCQDSDNGIDINTYGIVSRTVNGVEYIAKDKCLTSNKIVEQYCNGNVWRYSVLDCPENSICIEGVCTENCTAGSCPAGEVCIDGGCVMTDTLSDGTKGNCTEGWCPNYGGDTCNYTEYNNGTDLFLSYLCSNEVNPKLPENWVYDIMALQIYTTGLGIDLRFDEDEYTNLFIENDVKTGDYIGAFYMDDGVEKCAGFTDLTLNDMNMLYITTNTEGPYIAEGPKIFDDIYLKYYSSSKDEMFLLEGLEWYPGFTTPPLNQNKDKWQHLEGIFWVLKEASD